jgi:hypothetical protein
LSDIQAGHLQRNRRSTAARRSQLRPPGALIRVANSPWGDGYVLKEQHDIVVQYLLLRTHGPRVNSAVNLWLDACYPTRVCAALTTSSCSHTPTPSCCALILEPFVISPLLHGERIFFTLFLYKQEIKERAIQTSHTQQDRDLSPSNFKNFKLEWAMACRLRFLGCQGVDQQIMIARRRAWTLK